MHIYAFGSVCRGDIDKDSDIDLLAIVDKFDNRFDPDSYSIYSYKKIIALWEEGNPFAWHLSNESKMIYSSDKSNIILSLGKPNSYKQCKRVCQKFYELFCGSLDSIKNGGNSIVFELSTIFLSIRNFATCYLLGIDNIMNFSRYSAIQMGANSLKVSENTFELLKQARILSIRAKGKMIFKQNIKDYFYEIESIKLWMENLLVGVNNGRI
ncbi:MAG: hypothetical protein ACD_79C01416G0005 [uncultured bacterium]|nr:MAG: hypothetical protein ACD_79C01416G0005 [uncultured bacterium]